MADTTGQMHTGPAGGVEKPVAGGGVGRRGMMGGGRGAGRPKFHAISRMGLAFAELMTLAAFITITIGLSKLQKKANSLGPLPAATQLVYTDVFQSGGQVPYPNSGKEQFALQWWLLMFELVIFLIISGCLLMPRLLHRLRLPLLCFLTYMFTLVTLQVQSLLYFKRNAAASLVFGHHFITVTFAGLFLLVIANAFSIIFLGLLERDDLDGGRRGGVIDDGSYGKHRTVAQEPVGANVV